MEMKTPRRATDRQTEADTHTHTHGEIVTIKWARADQWQRGGRGLSSGTNNVQGFNRANNFQIHSGSREAQEGSI